MIPKNYYFDMDGVVALYDKSAYTGKNPKFLRKNEHYFLNLEPDRKMLEVIDNLYQKSRYTGNHIYLLTSISMNGAIFNEHFHDKILWASKWLPYLSIESILISVTSKRNAVEYIKDHKLSQNDILIDDYNKNLKEWNEAGGTAVKYLNGINSAKSYSLTKIKHTDDVATILDTFYDLEKTIDNSTGKEKI